MSAASVQAHDYHAAGIAIDHPYATPTPNGARHGAMYFRSITNSGKLPDRLLGVRTEVARAVEIHRGTITDNVVRMRAIPALELPAGGSVQLRHGGMLHLMLLDLNAPLKEGDRFTATLQFEKAGEREVTVWVQQPRAALAGHEHSH